MRGSGGREKGLSRCTHLEGVSRRGRLAGHQVSCNVGGHGERHGARAHLLAPLRRVVAQPGLKAGGGVGHVLQFGGLGSSLWKCALRPVSPAGAAGPALCSRPSVCSRPSRPSSPPLPSHLYTSPSFSMPFSAQSQRTAPPSLAAIASGSVLRPRRKLPTCGVRRERDSWQGLGGAHGPCKPTANNSAPGLPSPVPRRWQPPAGGGRSGSGGSSGSGSAPSGPWAWAAAPGCAAAAGWPCAPAGGGGGTREAPLGAAPVPSSQPAACAGGRWGSHCC